MVRKPTELRPIMTRIPEGLRRRLEKEAARNDRSMNAEIIARLWETFADEDRFGGPEQAAMLQNFAFDMARAKAATEHDSADDNLRRIAAAFLNLADNWMSDLHSVIIARRKAKGEVGRYATATTKMAIPVKEYLP